MTGLRFAGRTYDIAGNLMSRPTRAWHWAKTWASTRENANYRIYVKRSIRQACAYTLSPRVTNFIGDIDVLNFTLNVVEP